MLIKTKLQPAQLRSRMLLREDLIKRLCAAVECPLIQLTGPGGSGKTSLLCQWIKQEKLRTAWYSLDEEDNEPDLFFRYLLTTLTWRDEQLNKAFGPMLATQWALADADVIPHLIASLSILSGKIHLVLDDFHQISNVKLHAALARLIQYMPANLHLVILSRYSLPAPMDAVAIKKERLELSASDLKFTEKETANLYKEIIPLSFSPDQIRDLNRHVEGWAAGLQLIGLSLRSQGKISDLSYILNQSHEQFANYLIHDILKMQPQKIRDFVFATALLDRFNPALCTEVTGCADTTEVIARLERLNLFLIPLDTDRKWYRYHHIFSEVIRRQVAIEKPELITAILCKAAVWLAHNNYLEDALRCAFRSNDFEFAADLMEDYIIGYAETFDLAAGVRWITKLPESILNQRALLRLQQSGFLSILMELSDVREILAGIESNGIPDFGRYSGHKRELCQGYSAYLKLMLHILYAGETIAVDQIAALRDKIRPQNPLLVGAVETQIVFTFILKGELVPAENLLAGLAKVPISRSNQLMRKKIYHAKAKALIALHRGQLRRAETIILQVQQTLDRQGYGNSPMGFLLRRHLGTIFYQQNRLTEAWECAAALMKYRECEYFGLVDEILAGTELRLQLHRAAGEYEQAVQCIRQMQAYSIRLEMPRIAASADACAAQLAIDQENPSAAEQWSKRRNLRPDEPFSLLFAMECVIQARLYHAQKKYLQVADLLKTLRNRCVKRSLSELVLQIDILQSATLHAMNQPETAVALSKKALAFAENEGYLRPFVNDSKLIAPVLRNIADASTHTLSTAYLEKIMAACNPSLFGPTTANRDDGPHNEELTQREIEILEWMAQGMRNKDIAKKAFIAITTVKSHVRNIMGKLDSKTRIQAVLKAKEIGIISKKNPHR